MIIYCKNSTPANSQWNQIFFQFLSIFNSIVQCILDCYRMRFASIFCSKRVKKQRLLLHEAVISSSVTRMTSLLDRGVDINMQDNNGDTALHIAVNQEYEAGVHLLLDRGANVNSRGGSSETALHKAATRHNRDIFNTLIDNGADTDAQDCYCQTPLVHAIRSEFEYGFDLLVEKGVDVNVQDIDGVTPLHHAIYQKNLRTVKTLLDNGAETGRKSKYGQTPLHMAVCLHFDSGVELLLERGAVVNVRDMIGQTPLHCAAEQCSKNVVRMLFSNGASADIKDNRGRTALDTHPSVSLWLDELRKMKTVMFGLCSLNSAFCKYKDPVIVSNVPMRALIRSRNLRVDFPHYAFLLKVYFKKAEHRNILLNTAVQYLPEKLPQEVRRLILSYIEDKDLLNYIKAYEEKD